MAKPFNTAIEFPRFDLDALFGLQKANLAALHEAQLVLVDATQAVVRSQADYVRGLAARFGAEGTREAPKAEAVLADVKAATEQAMVVGKQQVDLGVAAQRRVTELLTARAQANLNELKSLAA